MDPLQAISLFRPIAGVENVGAAGAGSRAAKVQGVNPFAGAAAYGTENVGGEIISNYGAGGASALAYKGLSQNPNDTVGAKFDTQKLGLYW